VRIRKILIEVTGNDDVVIWVGFPQCPPVPRLNLKGFGECPPICGELAPRTSEPWQHCAIDD